MATSLGWHTVLERFSDEELVALLQDRPDLARGPASIAELEQAVTAPASLRSCMEQLDRGARQVLEAACVLEGAPLGALASRLGTEPEPLLPVLARLCGLALVSLRRGPSRPSSSIPASDA